MTTRQPDNQATRQPGNQTSTSLHNAHIINHVLFSAEAKGIIPGFLCGGEEWVALVYACGKFP